MKILKNHYFSDKFKVIVAYSGFKEHIASFIFPIEEPEFDTTAIGGSIYLACRSDVTKKDKEKIKEILKDPEMAPLYIEDSVIGHFAEYVLNPL